MSNKNYRPIRISDQIQIELDALIRHRMKDPRLGAVTITAVLVTRDYSHATIYVNSYLGRESLLRSLTALKDGAGFLRIHLRHVLRLRTIPELHFKEDDTLDRADRINELLQLSRQELDQYPGTQAEDFSDY
jgi:ribosome-binding factor A